MPSRSASRARTGLVLVVALSACSGNAAYKQALEVNTVDAWRRYLGDEPNPALVEAARSRLAELEFAEARKQNSVLAYRRFLDEFPQSPRASEARTLLENLHFEEARAADTAAAWAEFLLEHPRGAHAAEADRRLAERELEAARAAGTPAAFESFARRWPKHPQAEALAAAGDDGAYAQARAQGLDGLERYLAERPAGRHRDAARQLLRSREVEALLSLESLPAARDLARRAPSDELRASLLARIDLREVELAALTLDPAVLDETAGRLDGAAAEQARRASAELRKAGPGLAKLRAAVERLDPARFGRPAAELMQLLTRGGDAHEQRLAAEELGHVGGPDALDPLLAAVSDAPYLSVRLASLRGIERLAGALPELGRRHELETRARLLRPIARDAQLYVRLAVLEELLGNAAAAEEAWRRAVGEREDDPLPLLRLARLRLAREDRTSAAVAARRAYLAAAALAEERWRSTRQAGGAPMAAVVRQLCGAKEALATAKAVLDGLPATGDAALLTDVATWRAEATELVRLLDERLAEGEADLRADRPQFARCSDDAVTPRLLDGRAERLAVLRELETTGGARVAPVVARTAVRDPDGEVRAAAAAILSRIAAPASGAR